MKQHPKLVEMMRELIAIPSVSATSPRWDMGNRRVVEQLGNWLEALGFSVCITIIAWIGYRTSLRSDTVNFDRLMFWFNTACRFFFGLLISCLFIVMC